MIDSMNIDLICVCNVRCGNAFSYQSMSIFQWKFASERNANKLVIIIRPQVFVLFYHSLNLFAGRNDRHPLCGYCFRAWNTSLTLKSLVCWSIRCVFFFFFVHFVPTIGVRKLLAHVLILNRSSTWKLRIKYPVNEAVNLIRRIRFWFIIFCSISALVALLCIESKLSGNLTKCLHRTIPSGTVVLIRHRKVNLEAWSHSLNEFSTGKTP